MNSAYIDYTMANRMSFSMPKNHFFLLVICFSPIFFSKGIKKFTLHLKIAGYVVTPVSILYSGVILCYIITLYYAILYCIILYYTIIHSIYCIIAYYVEIYERYIYEFHYIILL